MLSGEDYIIVWVGVHRILSESDNNKILKGDFPLMALAHEVGVEVWHDTFEVDPMDRSAYSILVGKRLAILGYKEGRSHWNISAKKTVAELEIIGKKLAKLKVRQKPQLHVLLHLEDGMEEGD